MPPQWAPTGDGRAFERDDPAPLPGGKVRSCQPSQTPAHDHDVTDAREIIYAASYPVTHGGFRKSADE